jgi:hypothetical protein
MRIIAATAIKYNAQFKIQIQSVFPSPSLEEVLLTRFVDNEAQGGAGTCLLESVLYSSYFVSILHVPLCVSLSFCQILNRVHAVIRLCLLVESRRAHWERK